MKAQYRSLTEVPENGENIKALLFLTLGSKYLNLVHNVLEECIRTGNPHSVISSNSPDSSEFWKEYFQKTRWSDFMIIEPVLFNFYHGLELILKGLLFLTNQINVRSEHGLTDYFDRVDGIAEVPEDLKKIIKEHVMVNEENNPLIYAFLNENRITVDQLYESLRYPADKRLESFNKYFGLHYQEENSLEYFKKILADIRKLQNLGITFYRTTTGTGAVSLK